MTEPLVSALSNTPGAGRDDQRPPNVFETYWTTIRGVEAMDNNYRLLDLTVYERQETWEDSPTGWPQGDIMDTLRTDGRPTSQLSRLRAGFSDDRLGAGGGEGRLGIVRPVGVVSEDAQISHDTG